MTCKLTMTAAYKDETKPLPPFPDWVTPSTRCNSCKGCKIMSRPHRYYSSELKEWFRTCSKCLAKRRVRRSKEKHHEVIKDAMEDDGKTYTPVYELPHVYPTFDRVNWAINGPTASEGLHQQHGFSMTRPATTLFGTPGELPAPKLKEYRDAMGNVLKPTTLPSPSVFLAGESVFEMREEVQRSFQQSALAITSMYNNMVFPSSHYTTAIPPPVLVGNGGGCDSTKKFRSKSVPITPFIEPRSPDETYSLSECDASMQYCDDMLFDIFQDMLE